MKLWRKIAFLVVAAAVAALVVLGLIPKPAEVEIISISRAPMQVAVVEEGKTRVMDRFVVSAPVNGFMRRIGLKAGSRIKKGDIVAELEPLMSDALDPRSRAGAEARVNAARAALKAAEERAAAAAAEEERARVEHERIKRLFVSGYVSRNELDVAAAEAQRLEAELRSALFGVEVAGFELKEARAALKHSVNAAGAQSTLIVLSPVSGFVLKINGESERVVRAGEALMEVGDPSALEVITDVLSDDAVRIGPGTRVVFNRWGGDTPLEGLVRTVEPFGFTKVSALGIEEQRVLVVSDITTPPSGRERLGDGYRVETRFILWESDNVLQVPTSALFRQGDGWAAFVVQGEIAVIKPVELSHRNGLSAEVISGLKEGDKVITHPDDSVSDGVKVKIRD